MGEMQVQVSADDVELRESIEEMLDEAGIEGDHPLITRIIAAGLGLGQDAATRLNLKISAAAIEELRAAFHLFTPYLGVRKATIFGSARTTPGDPRAQQAEAIARRLADLGWMVVTGAGPGIMEAAATGAGQGNALGVSIRLPFEEPTQGSDTDLRVVMKYFFTRKLMLVKESSAFISLPGGFGTMDEVFEVLTLQQTGKMEPMPIVLLDRPGGTFWERFQEFVIDEVEGGGFTTRGDLDRVLITSSVDAAIDEIASFWRNYDSLRWVQDDLVIRLHAEPIDTELEALNEQFGDLLESGTITRTEPLAVEIRDNDRVELPRIRLMLKRRAVGELHRIIRAVNQWESASREVPSA